MLQVIKEVERSMGYVPATDASGVEYPILEGQPLMLTSDGKIKPYDGTTGTFPMGLAAESNVQFPLQGKPYTAGYGFDYSRFNRGGLISFFFAGGMFELASDVRGVPFVDTDTYEINKPVYANPDGKITATSNSGANPEIGKVMKFTVASGKVVSLVIKLTI